MNILQFKAFIKEAKDIKETTEKPIPTKIKKKLIKELSVKHPELIPAKKE